MNAPARPNIIPVLIFTAIYMAAAIAGAIASGNREFIIYIGVMLVLIPSILAVHRKYPLTPPLFWAFSVWGLLHMAGGLLPIPQGWFHQGPHAVLYSWWLVPGYLKYDQVTHAYGFGITSWLCWHVIKSSLRSPDGSPVRPTPGILLLCAAAGMGFGAFNEVIEFTATRILPDTNVGDYENTGWDLVSNLVGSVIAALIIRWGKTRKTDGKPAQNSP
ncbi:MAG TPA: DUF2238 domain-containing protein [Verrucomicrobiales bacterium]|nr:DUF2238 domain-containing protein [Verrucomicrobiales bacterium]